MLTSGSDSSDSESCEDRFPVAAENAAKKGALTAPTEEEPFMET